ncbi:MAG: excinuclease ABC subunit C [Desulfovibrio sp.]|nr:excinuclease ABC subunit C [Desulfovibrio sp.]
MQKPDPSSLPNAPGVYLYKDEQGTIIYVGKARILKRRILSYFRKDGLSTKTQAMLSHAKSLDFLTTTTEKEALLLEASLIKKHHPHYNIALRDDKQYVLFRLDPNEQFPRLTIVRQAHRDGARYFGPFTSAQAARNTWKLLHKTFGLRRCSDRAMKNRVRPCLYFHMGQCLAPCAQSIDPIRYQNAVLAICHLLDGKIEPLIEELTAKMEQASASLSYETAITYRDQIRAIEQTVEQQAVILPGKRDTDVIGLYASDAGMTVGIVCVRNGAISDGRAYYWQGLRFEDAGELLSSFLTQYYAYQLPPPRILLPWRPDDTANYAHYRAEQAAQEHEKTRESILESVQKAFQEAALHNEENAQNTGAPLHTQNESASFTKEDEGDFSALPLEEYLSERRKGAVHIVLPKNSLESQLLDMAQANAREESKRKEQKSPTHLLERLQKALFLSKVPHRIECVDVSHTQGSATRVGKVTFLDGEASKENYRVYAMPESNDDYATLAAWVQRRIKSGPPWPDLLLVDGGRGQVAAVARALAQAEASDLFPIAGIAKARTEEGTQDRRAGNVADRIFLPNRSNPLAIKAGSAELLLLQHIRDTAHSFAIRSHRKAHKKDALTGEIQKIPHVGPKTARLLWDHFGSLDAMCQADAEEIARIPGLGMKKAIEIANHLAHLREHGLF